MNVAVYFFSELQLVLIFEDMVQEDMVQEDMVQEDQRLVSTVTQILLQEKVLLVA